MSECFNLIGCRVATVIFKAKGDRFGVCIFRDGVSVWDHRLHLRCEEADDAPQVSLPWGDWAKRIAMEWVVKIAHEEGQDEETLAWCSKYFLERMPR